jgi:hypothetical protein
MQQNPLVLYDNGSNGETNRRGYRKHDDDKPHLALRYAGGSAVGLSVIDPCVIIVDQ